MALGNTNGFDYTLGGEPVPAATGKVDTTGFDYTLGGEPLAWLVKKETQANTNIVLMVISNV